VRDALADERFAHNPLVLAEPHIRFYAGAPLRTADGHALGTLCVIDHVPREFTTEQRAALEALSRQVIAQLELRRCQAQLQRISADASPLRPALALGRSGAPAARVAAFGQPLERLATQLLVWIVARDRGELVACRSVPTLGKQFDQPLAQIPSGDRVVQRDELRGAGPGFGQLPQRPVPQLAGGARVEGDGAQKSGVVGAARLAQRPQHPVQQHGVVESAVDLSEIGRPAVLAQNAHRPIPRFVRLGAASGERLDPPDGVVVPSSATTRITRSFSSAWARRG
jgi:hypothetical protein